MIWLAVTALVAACAYLVGVVWLTNRGTGTYDPGPTETSTAASCAPMAACTRKLSGAANAIVAPGHDTDRLWRRALSGVPHRCAGNAFTRSYTVDGGS
jgi:hypothetical protein